MNKRPIPEVLDREILFNLGALIPETDYREFYYFLLLTGARVTEGLLIGPHDFREAKSRKTGNLRWVVTLLTEKRKDRLPRTIPLKLFQDATEDALVNAILNSNRSWQHLDRSIVWRKFKHYITYEETLKQLSRPLMETFQGRERIAKRFRIFPHYLRHCRATHLKDVLTRNQFKQYFGWKSDDMASVYVHQYWEDLEI